jgi:hypothetical protein
MCQNLFPYFKRHTKSLNCKLFFLYTCIYIHKLWLTYCIFKTHFRYITVHNIVINWLQRKHRSLISQYNMFCTIKNIKNTYTYNSKSHSIHNYKRIYTFKKLHNTICHISNVKTLKRNLMGIGPSFSAALYNSFADCIVGNTQLMTLRLLSTRQQSKRDQLSFNFLNGGMLFYFKLLSSNFIEKHILNWKMQKINNLTLGVIQSMTCQSTRYIIRNMVFLMIALPLENKKATKDFGVVFFYNVYSYWIDSWNS